MAGTFHFTCLDTKTKSILSEPALDDVLKKWSMKNFLRIQKYGFNEAFQLYQKQDFAEAFFADPNVVASLESFAVGSTAAAAPIGKMAYNALKLYVRLIPFATGRVASSVSVQRLPCTLTSTAIFRRLAKVGVVRGEDLIASCPESLVGDIVISDRLRRILLDEEDEDWDLFDHSERSEFLFQLLRLLVVGGRWCQYEDRLTPYLDAARAIYKEIVSVEKNSDGVLTVRTVVLKVVARDEEGKPIIPIAPEHPQEALFLCIDPVRRTVSVLSHHYGDGFHE